MRVPLLVSRIVRTAAAAVLALALGTALSAAIFPVWLSVVVIVLLGVSLWRPEVGILVLLVLAPWGERYAGVPVRAAESLCAAFLLAWLIRLDRVLIPDWRAAQIGRAHV